MLKLAIPGKGRIKDMTLEYLDNCGLSLIKDHGERSYSGRVGEISDIKILYNRPDEIPDLLNNGEVDLGITGVDLMAEIFGGVVPPHLFMKNLGYGKANLVIAVPESWIDVDTIDDLEDIAIELRQTKNRGLKIATSFPKLTHRYLSNSQLHDFRIVFSAGATESLPAKGMVDAITDITSTGNTLVQNNLKVLSDGIILKSQVNLFVNGKIDWNQNKLTLLKKLLRRIESYERSKTVQHIEIRFGHRKNTDSFIADIQSHSAEIFNTDSLDKFVKNPKEPVEVICDKSKSISLIDRLSLHSDFSYIIRNLEIYGKSEVETFSDYLNFLEKHKKK